MSEVEDLLARADIIHRMMDGIFVGQMAKDLPKSYIKVMSRIKSRESIENKIAKKRAEGALDFGLKDLTDIVGFRMVCHFQADVARTVRMLLGMIRDQYGLCRLVEPATFYTTNAANQSTLRAAVDSIFNEYGMKVREAKKDSRYTSLHLVCTVKRAEDFPPIEIQIRNVFEEAWASIEHATKYKGRPVSMTVSRHLTVLMSMVQCCIEYAEAIRLDMDDGGVDQSASIKPLTDYEEDIALFPPQTRRLFSWIMAERVAEQHKKILDRILEVLRVDNAAIHGDALYYLRMEEALSQLKLNDLGAARSLYDNIALKFPRRAMVPHRLSDVFKLKGEFAVALKYARKAESLLESDPDGSSKKESAWISTYLPLKKAYYLWRLGDPKQARDELAVAYAKFPEHGDELLRRKFFSSLIYYALETAVAENNVDTAQFNEYLQQMRGFKMQSIETALPEEVDTYAWVCHHLGLKAEASRAILEVLSCLHTKDPILGPIFIHKGKNWSVSPSDIATIQDHMRDILVNYASIPVTEIKPARYM